MRIVENYSVERLHTPNNIINSEYVLVYGTLRKGAGNWHYILKDTSEHIETFILDGTFKGRFLACKQSDELRGKSGTVFDLFKLNKDTLEKTNFRLDNLEGISAQYDEGYYTVTLIHMEHPQTGEKIVAKFYEVREMEANVNVEEGEYLVKSYFDEDLSYFKTDEKSANNTVEG